MRDAVSIRVCRTVRGVIEATLASPVPAPESRIDSPNSDETMMKPSGALADVMMALSSARGVLYSLGRRVDILWPIGGTQLPADVDIFDALLNDLGRVDELRELLSGFRVVDDFCPFAPKCATYDIDNKVVISRSLSRE